jgi:hypothetical protein
MLETSVKSTGPAHVGLSDNIEVVLGSKPLPSAVGAAVVDNNNAIEGASLLSQTLDSPLQER